MVTEKRTLKYFLADLQKKYYYIYFVSASRKIHAFLIRIFMHIAAELETFQAISHAISVELRTESVYCRPIKPTG